MRKVWIFALTALALGLILGVVLSRIRTVSQLIPPSQNEDSGEIILETDNASRRCVVSRFTERIHTRQGRHVLWNIENNCGTPETVRLEFGPRDQNPLDPPEDPVQVVGPKEFMPIVKRVSPNAVPPGEERRRVFYHIVVGGQRFSPEELEIYR